MWSAHDALVLKAQALVLAKHLPVSCRCTHLNGRDGATYAVREVRDPASSNFCSLNRSPRTIMAQAIRAILLASATAATLVGRRPIRRTRHSRPHPWPRNRDLQGRTRHTPRLKSRA